jgi:Leucine-rich repeat (LRR) protein
MKRRLNLAVAFFMLVYCVFGNGIILKNTVKAEGVPEIEISVPEQLHVGKSYDIQIKAANVTNLYGYSIDFVYNPKLVQLSGITGGNIFSTVEAREQELTKSYDNEFGSLAYCKILTGAEPGIDANGNLVTLHFTAVGEGPFNFSMSQNPTEQLTLEENTIRVLLTDKDGKHINFNSSNIVRDITFDTVPPQVTATVPMSGTSGVSVNPEMTLNYDEEVKVGDNFDNITLLDLNDKPVLVSAEIEANTLKLKPDSKLLYNSNYTLLVPAGAVKDQFNNGTVLDSIIAFITEKAPEDINKDGLINIFDVALVARAYGMKSTEEGWNQALDVTGDGIINLFDLIAIAREFKTEQAIRIQSVNNVDVTVPQDSLFTFPTEVAANMSDGTTRNVAVTWSSSRLDTTKTGKYIFEGTVRHYASKVRLVVNVVSSAAGNTNSNLMHDGLFQQHGDWVYYSDSADSRRLFKRKVDGSNRTLVSNDLYVTQINIVGDYIYYVSDFALIRIKTDGTERTVLNGSGTYMVNISGDWIYWLSNWNDGIYKMRLDGTERTAVISTYGLYSMSVHDDWIYSFTGGNIIKIKTDGTSITHLDVNDARFMVVEGDWIYYLSHWNNLYRIKTDGTSHSQICSDWIESINVSGDWVYYSNLNDGHSLYKIRTDGTDKTKLANKPVIAFINVTGDWVYYRNYDYSTGQETYYRVRTNGTDNQLVSRISHIDTVYRNVSQGQILSLPKTVIATMDDGSTAKVNISWDSHSIDTNAMGTYTVEGSVIGYSSKVILQITVVSADIVSFADPNLEAVMRSVIGKYNGNIYITEVESISTLHAEGLGLYDLTGIEYLRNLEYLYLSSNEITDLTPLSNLIKLKTLHLHGNRVSDLSPLSALINLETLDLVVNQIRELDSLANLTKLQQLYLFKNYISDIRPLSSLVELKVLLLQDNQITDISALSNLTNLHTLVLVGNQIRDISPLANLTNLESLYLNGNKISDLPPLEGLTSLSNLGLSWNQINDISALSSLTSLKSLYLQYNQISDVSPLASLVNLKSLYLYGNPITDYSPLAAIYPNLSPWERDFWLESPASDLKIVRVDNLSIDIYKGDNFEFPRHVLATYSDGTSAYIPVTWNSYEINNNVPGVYSFEGTVNGYSNKVLLEVAIIENNEVAFADSQLEASIRQQLGKMEGTLYQSDVDNIYYLYMWTSAGTLDLSGIENLRNLADLYIYGYELNDFSPLYSLKNLQILSLWHNNISDVTPFANMTNLFGLGLCGNQIDDISGLANLTNLSWLELINNKIADITPLSNLTNLAHLNLGMNSVSDLRPLSSMKSLQSLDLYLNNITDISILSELRNLYYINAANNQISNISGLEKLTRLDQLYLSQNQISDISNLHVLKELQYLTLASNRITDVSTIDKLTQLVSLDLSNNQLSNESSIGTLMNLRYLSLGNTGIKDISFLSALASLHHLSLSYNEISDIKALSGLTGLVSLDIRYTSISDVSPLSGLRNLEHLYLQGAPIDDYRPLSTIYNQLCGRDFELDIIAP